MMPLNIGVTTRSFPQLTNAEAAELIANEGFRCIELCFSQTDSNYWVYNGRSDLSDMTSARAREIAETYRHHGLDIVALGVFTNLLHVDDTERRENLSYFQRMMEIAQMMGISAVATECGFMPGQRGIHADEYESRFQRLVDSLTWLSETAKPYGLTVALEPCVLDVVPSAKRTADLLRQIGASNLGTLLDPANLIANSTEEEMFTHLKGRITYLHGKDRKVNAAYGSAVGDGDIDWPRFFKAYESHAAGLPVVLEYVTAETFRTVRDRTLAFAAQVLE